MTYESTTNEPGRTGMIPQYSGETESRQEPTEQRSNKRSLFADPIPWMMLVAALVLDQLSKAIVIANLDRGESWPDGGFLRITHAWNTGTAFSLFQGQSDLLTIFSFVAVIALYFVYRSLQNPNIWVRMAFGLLLGGAFGNLIDRLRLGHVTDFFDVGPWPIFNIADSSIVVGITVLFLYFWLTADSSKNSGKKSDSEQNSETAPPGTPGQS
jgi:signal peptidase II